MKITEKAKWSPKWTFRYFDTDGKTVDTKTVDGNLLLNEGITELLTLLIGGSATAFNNANSYIGIGDSATAAVASQTGLIGTTNKYYRGMDATYPQVADQTVTFRATIPTTEGNFAINEVTVANGNSDAADNLNRKVVDLGTKSSNVSLEITLEITIS